MHLGLPLLLGISLSGLLLLLCIGEVSSRVLLLLVPSCLWWVVTTIPKFLRCYVWVSTELSLSSLPPLLLVLLLFLDILIVSRSNFPRFPRSPPLLIVLGRRSFGLSCSCLFDVAPY